MAREYTITKTCAVTDCDRPLLARGLCAMHYQRMRNHGSVEKPVRQRVPIPHGTLQGYGFHRCRCEDCRRVRSNYSQQWNERMADHCWEYQLRHTYGMVKAEYDERLAAQGGACAICGDLRFSRGRKHLDVDHDHSTGAVRGILCNRCNQNVGRVERSIARFPGVLEYLGWRHD